MNARAASARVVLLATVLAGSASGGATAQPVSGFYLGGAVGYGLLQTEGTTASPPSPAFGGTAFGGGVAAVGGLGYGLGNGLRVEVEGDYRSNGQRHGGSGNGSESKFGVMGNVLFDVDPGVGWAFPYLGLGFGYQDAAWHGVRVAGTGLEVSQSVGGFAYQAIVGVAFPLDAAPGLSLTMEYRYLGLGGARSYHAASRAGPARVRAGGDDNHAILVGLRYAFDAASNGGALERPPLALEPGGATSRTYLVFIEWDRADLTARARDVVAEAARASTTVAHIRIDVAGRAGDANSPADNQALALRRAQNVAAEMERAGVPAAVIDVHAYGDNHLLANAGAGMPETRDRRVEIVYR